MALIPNPDSGVTQEALNFALEGMILSASGWRGVFAASGNEESAEEVIDAPHRLIAAGAAKVFADYLARRSPGQKPGVIVGMDTRPTGKAIAEAIIRTLLDLDCDVLFTEVAAAPEIMAYARTFADAPAKPGVPEGFIFISASHNPIGHNGLKFGLTDGGTLSASEASILIDAFHELAASGELVQNFASSLKNRQGNKALGEVYTAAPKVKRDALRAYDQFTREVTSGFGDPERQERFFQSLRQGIEKRPLGIGADLNGSARAASVDRDFFANLGIPFRAINDQPGNIAHRIVPEGESLEPCREFLERLHRENNIFTLGYLPDCDGDRGNLVIWDNHGARSLEAQEVFALSCVAELAHLVWTRELRYDKNGAALDKVAIAVNDPTSMRIDRIARAFDAAVFRAEVGEANVVNLARKLRKQGYLVRILGEGSAGGNITHPSAVRDPLDTIIALVKLLTIRNEGEKKGFFQIWRDLYKKAEAYRADFTLSDIIAALPPFVTTGVYAPEALLQVQTRDHGLLKDRYQEIFLREWEERKDFLESRYGICGWEAAAYQGTEEKRGIKKFGEAQRGGLRIIFSNTSGAEIASIWMRGSGTEPVFRIMADAEGSDRRLERDLIEWQRRMTIAADTRQNKRE